MHFGAWLIASFAIFCGMLVLAIVLAKQPYKRGRYLTPNKVLLCGSFLSAVVLLCPIYLEKLFESKGVIEYLKSIMISSIHSLRLFAFDSGYADCFESQVIRSLDEPLQTLYSCFGALLYIVAPMLTLKFVVSFFKDAAAYRKFLFSFRMHTHVFSELNEKSLALAESIDEKYNKSEKNPEKYRFFRKALFIFHNVSDTREKKSELLEEAKKIGAICFSKDLEAIKYSRSKKHTRRLSFYLMGSEEDNLRQAESLMQNYDLDSVGLRVFSTDIRTELLLAAKDVINMQVIRINEVQSLIYHSLDLHGMRLFKNARAVDDGEKVISAVIVGLGDYGTEMLKALSWFGQMDGYKLKIRAFDIDMAAKDKLTVACPELMDERLNGKDIEGEARYDIDVVGGVEIDGSSFADKFAEITDATYVFVSLGDDVKTLDAAIKIRSLCERIRYCGDGRKPDIEAVIRDHELASSMGEKWQGDEDGNNTVGVTNFKNVPYRIHMIGSIRELYSVDTMLNSALISEAEGENAYYAQCLYEDALKKAASLPEAEAEAKKAEAEARKKENLRAFYKYDYNYRSSLARIIHVKKSEELGTRGAIQEHKRWNAYMRSEGYRFSGSLDGASRNDLGKLHHNLVPFDHLYEEVDIKKDE